MARFHRLERTKTDDAEIVVRYPVDAVPLTLDVEILEPDGADAAGKPKTKLVLGKAGQWCVIDAGVTSFVDEAAFRADFEPIKGDERSEALWNRK